MTEKRFMVDDAGTLIDMQTREMYDIVEEICPVLNALYNENEQLKKEKDYYKRELQKELVCQAVIDGRKRMTEKRFKRISVCGDWGIKDVQNDKVLFFATTDEVDDTLKVLNELHEENKKIKNDEKQLRRVLRNHYLECQKWSDTHTQLIIKQIANDLGVDLE